MCCAWLLAVARGALLASGRDLAWMQEQLRGVPGNRIIVAEGQLEVEVAFLSSLLLTLKIEEHGATFVKILSCAHNIVWRHYNRTYKLIPNSPKTKDSIKRSALFLPWEGLSSMRSPLRWGSGCFCSLGFSSLFPTSYPSLRRILVLPWQHHSLPHPWNLVGDRLHLRQIWLLCL